MAEHDGRGGLIATEEGRQKLNIFAPKRITKRETKTTDCEVPSLKELDSIHLKYFGNKEVDFEKVFDKVETDARKQGRVLCSDWRKIVEIMLDDTRG